MHQDEDGSGTGKDRDRGGRNDIAEEKNVTRKEMKSSSGSSRVNSRGLKVVPRFDTETIAEGQFGLGSQVAHTSASGQ